MHWRVTEQQHPCAALRTSNHRLTPLTIPQLHWYRVIALAVLALTAPAMAAPLPAGGQFPIAGAPAFLSGAYYQVSPETGVRITLIQDNQIGNWNLGIESNTTLHGSYLAIQSFKCLDANTAMFMSTGVRPTDNATIPSSCSIAFVNDTHAVMRWYATPTASPQDACPDTPFEDDPNAVTVVYERLEGIVPVPSSGGGSLTCKNVTTTPKDLLDVKPVLPGPHGPKLPPRTPYPQPGGAPLNSGVATIASAAYLSFATDVGYASLAALPRAATIPERDSQQKVSMYVGTYVDHACLTADSYRAYAYEANYHINGTVTYTYTCEVGRREVLENGTAILLLALPTKNTTNCPPDLFDSPDAYKITLTTIEDLPWKPVTDCFGGETSPSPTPLPAPPSGAAGLAALPAALMFLLYLLM